MGWDLGQNVGDFSSILCLAKIFDLNLTNSIALNLNSLSPYSLLSLSPSVLWGSQLLLVETSICSFNINNILSWFKFMSGLISINLSITIIKTLYQLDSMFFFLICWTTGVFFYRNLEKLFLSLFIHEHRYCLFVCTLSFTMGALVIKIIYLAWS